VSFHGRHAAVAREGSLVLEPLGVVPGQDEERGSLVRADAWQTEQLRGHFRHQPLQLCVELSDLLRVA
jgi:hypothetical protein